MVNKKTKISAVLGIKSFQKQKSIKLLVQDSLISELLISLVLLRESLIDLLELQFDNSTFYLRVLDGNTSICKAYDNNGKNVKLLISINTLEYFIFYLLKYYRDGIAEVGHIDLDFSYSGDQTITWTISIANFKEYTSDEIREILKM